MKCKNEGLSRESNGSINKHGRGELRNERVVKKKKRKSSRGEKQCEKETNGKRRKM